MSMLIANNLWATLAADITDTATSILLSAGQGSRFPNIIAGDWMYLTLFDKNNDSEIVKVTHVAGDTLTVVRAQDGTVAQAWTASGTRAEHRETAGFVDALKADLDAAISAGGYAFTGALTLAGDPTAADMLMTKGYADTTYLPSTTSFQPPSTFDFIESDANNLGLSWDGANLHVTANGADLGFIWRSGNFNPSAYANTAVCQLTGGFETGAVGANSGGSVNAPVPYVTYGVRLTGNVWFMQVALMTNS